MSIDAYLKTAAAQLRRAATALKSDIKEVEQYIAGKQDDTKRDVQSLEQMITRKQVEINKTDDNMKKTQLNKEIADLKQQISQLQQDHEADKSNQLSRISQIEGAIDQLGSQASDLERQPGDF